jgi:uncharacterized damage-inducible protein DinB
VITPEHARLLARYNRWQNESIYGAASGLSDAARRQDRGAFFGTIHGTLSHLIWADSMWMHRFTSSPKPAGTIADSPSFIRDWDEMAASRSALDAAIIAWAAALQQDWLGGDYTWTASSTGRISTRPNWVLATHVFNHQTHHRGQVHAMLTAAGGQPGVTDVIFMPDEA